MKYGIGLWSYIHARYRMCIAAGLLIDLCIHLIKVQNSAIVGLPGAFTICWILIGITCRPMPGGRCIGYKISTNRSWTRYVTADVPYYVYLKENILRTWSKIRPQLSAASPTNRHQPKVIITIVIVTAYVTIVIIKLKPATGCDAKVAAELSSRPLVCCSPQSNKVVKGAPGLTFRLRLFPGDGVVEEVIWVHGTVGQCQTCCLPTKLCWWDTCKHRELLYKCRL